MDMASPRKVLVVDHNPDSRFLLTKTLLRKFPHVMVLECADAESAVSTAAEGELDVIVVHRAESVSGVDVIRMLREVTDSVPIIMVSGIDRSVEALAAGANFFLSYDEWLRIGTVVAELLSLPLVEGHSAVEMPLDPSVASLLRNPRSPVPEPPRGTKPEDR
jgi:CheY-like chemotaxis protein